MTTKERAKKAAQEIFEAAYEPNTNYKGSDFDIDLAGAIIERELTQAGYEALADFLRRPCPETVQPEPRTTYGNLKPL